jgi:hypothetical protein
MITEVLTMVDLPDDGQVDPRLRIMVRQQINVSQMMLCAKYNWLLGRRETTVPIIAGKITPPNGCTPGALKSVFVEQAGTRILLTSMMTPDIINMSGFPSAWKWENGTGVRSISVDVAGTGAVVGGTVTISAPTSDPGIQATAYVSAISGGGISEVTVLNQGIGYDTVVTATAVAPSSGSTLSVTTGPISTIKVAPYPADGTNAILVWDAQAIKLEQDEDEPIIDPWLIIMFAAVTMYPKVNNSEAPAELGSQAKAYLDALRPRPSGSMTLNLNPLEAVGGWCQGGRTDV